MKKIITSDKVRIDINAKLYSDLHYVPGDDLSFLRKSIDDIEYNRPNYVFFLGDLIDDSIYSLKELRKVLTLMSKMAKFSKVILVLGNHDQFTKNENGHWEENYNLEYVEELKNMGIIVLQNETYNDENIFVHGTQFTGMYYEEREPKNIFLENIKKVDYNNSEQFNILLEHSPRHTFDTETMESLDNLSNVDLVLAGHYHNGCIPWYVSKIIPGNFGLIDPYLNVMPKNARGEKQITENTYGIISAPLTTFSSNSKLLRKVNKFYPSVNQDIVIKKR